MSSRLEQYLDDVARPVSAEHRAEWKEETRQHLEEIIVANEERGMSHEQAEIAALQSFGEAQRIGKGVEHETQKVRPTLTGVLSGAAVAVGIAPLCYLLSACFFWGRDPLTHLVMVLLWNMIAGPVLWTRRTRPLRAALWVGGIYLVLVAAIMLTFIPSELAHVQSNSAGLSPDKVNALRNTVIGIARDTTLFVALQGLLVGGSVSALRDWQLGSRRRRVAR